MSTRYSGNAEPPSAAADVGSRSTFYVGLLAALVALYLADRQLLAIVAEPVKLDLQLSDAEVGALTGTIFGVVFVLSSIPIAWAADRISRIGLITVGAAFWTICTAATGWASGFQQLALTRAGLALGEAALTPCVQSLVADYVPTECRGRATVLLLLGIPMGYVAAAVAGGLLVDRLGWRAMFWVLGGVSFVIALIAISMLPEPARKSRSVGGSTADRASQRQGYRELLRKKTFQNMMIAAALIAIANSGGGNWSVVYIVRYFDWTVGQAGAAFGGAFAVVGFLGIWLGGRLADHLMKRDARWPLWLPALALAIAPPVFIAGLLSTVATFYVAAVTIVIFLLLLATAPFLATLQRLTPDSACARAAATLGVISNLIGMGVGPLLIGAISDLLAPVIGVQSLRGAFVVLALPQILAAYFLWKAAQTLVSEVND